MPTKCYLLGISIFSNANNSVQDVVFGNREPCQQKKGVANLVVVTPFLLSGLLDSNQRPRAPQTCALPTALNPEHSL